ncbi:MAG: protein kinase domain-containing protein [Chloroflexota bacterium]
MKNLVGTTLRHYQILVRVRETGTRILYRAYDPRVRRHVGLEVLKIHCTDQPSLLALLQDQAKKNAKLTHPNIAPLIDSGIEEGVLFLVYDFYPERPLRRFFNRTYSWQETARELVSVTQAVAYAHEAGICHGALNPYSIILNDKKSPMLFDFGFEQIIREFTLAHSPGAWINKWGYEYLPPEQLNGELPTPRSDIYALGMILHEWINGEIALLDPTPLDTLRKRLFPPSKKNKPAKEVPTPIRELIEKCIAADPAERYQSMQEVGLILARGALDLTITRSMVRKPLAALAMRPAGKRLQMGAIVLAVLALGAAAVWGVGAGFPSRERSAETESSIPFTAAPSRTPRPTSTPVPTQTAVSSTVAVNAPTQPTSSIYPLFQGAPLTSITQAISSENIRQVVPVSIWGMGDLNDLSASPDGRYLAAGTSRGLFFFDPQTLEFVRFIDTNSQVSTIAFSADGNWIAAGDRDGLIRLWNTDTWQMEGRTLSGHRDAVLDLAFSPDGNRLASVGLDGNLLQWTLHSTDAPSPAPLKVMGVSSVAYSADGAHIVTGDSLFKLNVWDAGNDTLARSITLSSKVLDLAAIEGSSLAAAAGSDRRIVVVDIDGSAGAQTIGTLQYPLTAIAVSPQGSLFAGADVTGGIVVWNREGTQLWKAQGNPLTAASGTVHRLSFSPDGKTLYSGVSAGTLRAFDAATGNEIQQNRSFDVHVSRLAVSHNGKYLLTQHTENTVGVWDIWNGGLLYRTTGVIQSDNPFSRNDQYFAIAFDPSTVKVFSTANGDERYTFNKHENIETIQFIQDDTLLAAGNDRIIHLWSMMSGQELKITRNYSGSGCANYLDLKENPVLSVTTSFQHIMEEKRRSPMLCGFTRVDWMKAFYLDEESGSLAYGGNSQLFARTKNNQERPMEGVNLHNVVSVALHPDGSLIAAAYDDHTIHIWDIASRQEVMTLFGHGAFITDLRFSPDGKFLISASLDGTIRLWGVPD